jgi:hypothetical protein
MKKQSMAGKVFIRVFWFIVLIALILGIISIIRLVIL